MTTFEQTKLDKIEGYSKPRAFDINCLAKDFLAGSLAGVATILSGHPFE